MVIFRMGKARRDIPPLTRREHMWRPCLTTRTASHLNKQYVEADFSAVQNITPICLLSLLSWRSQVIPARGSNSIHASFTPLTLSELGGETRCVGKALGFLSLHNEVTCSVMAKVAHVCPYTFGYILSPFSDYSWIFVSQKRWYGLRVWTWSRSGWISWQSSNHQCEQSSQIIKTRFPLNKWR